MNGEAAGGVTEDHASVWRTIEATLSPIIGTHGVAALFRRTVDISRSRYPWLHMGQSGAMPDDWIAALATSLSTQPPQEATAANDEILQAFADLLGKLIGGSLADRLLPSTGHTSSRPKTSKDTWTP